MNVLVTGGHGFLGKHVVEALERDGHAVRAPSRDDLDLRRPVSDAELRALGLFGTGPLDVLVHTAALVGGLGFVNGLPLQVLGANALIHWHAIWLAQRLGVQAVIGIGSACTYPDLASGGDSLREADFDAGPPHPSVRHYAQSKRLLDALQDAWAAETFRPSRHLVLANLYGPGDRAEESRAHAATALIRRFARATAEGAPTVTVWGDGTAEREFLYVGDAAAAVAAAVLEVGARLGPVSDGRQTHLRLNIGTGISTSIRDYVSALVEATGYAGDVRWDPSRPVGVTRKVCDVEAAALRLDWTASTPLRDGLAKAVAWERARL